VLSPVQIVDDIINSVLDEVFPAEKAASDVISELLDHVMKTVKPPGVHFTSHIAFLLVLGLLLGLAWLVRVVIRVRVFFCIRVT